VSWKNVLAGPGSTSLRYVAPDKWRSECSQQLLYSLRDCDGTLVFKVTYFLSGGCPDGQRQSCRYPGEPPFTLILADYKPSPFHLRFKTSSRTSPPLGNNGYSEFSVDEP
jgi:hypothetical protein